MTNIAKNTICLWYDNDAEDAARFRKKYEISLEQIKTAHVNWYLAKIRDYGYAICD